MPRENTKAQSRLERAIIIRNQVVDKGRTSGQWERIDIGGGREARILTIEGDGWDASITSRFSGICEDFAVRSYGEAIQFQSAPPRQSDVQIDVHLPDAGKVLSIETIDGTDKLIGMQPGPWEAKFGLPAREWTPAFARRLARGADKP